MKAILTAMAAAGLLCASPAFADDALALAKSKNCLACHSVDAKLVGPAYKDVAAKYAGQADEIAYLAGKIKGGSSGVWGPVPMPPNAVSDDEAKTLATWISGLK